MTSTEASAHRLERRVADFVAANDLLRPGERALLLLSGGADSMALLALMALSDRHLVLGAEFAALHVDYATRGADSTRDAEIVARGCAAAGVRLHLLRLAQRPSGTGFQARARDIRYGHAREIVASEGYDVIVTAHNRDDQAETVLYRLAKYATPRGLAGMRPREGDLSRPLLCAGAGEIREYCRTRGIEYGEDVTNARTVYARNVIRHEVLPVLRRLNPRAAETLADAAALAAAEQDVLAAATAAASERAATGVAAGELAALDIAALLDEPAALRTLVLHEAVRDALGGEVLVERRVVEALDALCARGDAAGAMSLGRGLQAVRLGGRLVIRRGPPAHECTPAQVGWSELAAAGAAGAQLAFCGRRYRVALVKSAALDLAAASRGEACVGVRETPRRITLRHPRRGERFAPHGLGSETTAARFLAAARAPVDRRARAVCLDADGELAWLGWSTPSGARGRVAQGFAVDESCSYTLHLREEDT